MSAIPESYRAERCPDCGAGVGGAHVDGCDVERCSVCHGQRLGCGCEGHDPAASAWQGFWPGTDVAVEHGWWVIGGDRGWESCSSDTPGAMPDLNRATYFLLTNHDMGPGGT